MNSDCKMNSDSGQDFTSNERKKTTSLAEMPLIMGGGSNSNSQGISFTWKYYEPNFCLKNNIELRDSRADDCDRIVQSPHIVPWAEQIG